MLVSWSMKINNDIIIKLTLVYWLLLIVAQYLFQSFTSIDYKYRSGGGWIGETIIEWELIFQFAIFIPVVAILIIKILQWGKKS